MFELSDCFLTRVPEAFSPYSLFIFIFKHFASGADIRHQINFFPIFSKSLDNCVYENIISVFIICELGKHSLNLLKIKLLAQDLPDHLFS